MPNNFVKTLNYKTSKIMIPNSRNFEVCAGKNLPQT